MSTDWILRVGDGANLVQSSPWKIWGVSSAVSCTKHFLKHVRVGDRLWFVRNKSQGKILAVSTCQRHVGRAVGPLINVTMSSGELGWTGEGEGWVNDTEVHYGELYNLEKYGLTTGIKGPASIRKYTPACAVDLTAEYKYLTRYLQPVERLETTLPTKRQLHLQ
jgi:hypothetical protein